MQNALVPYRFGYNFGIGVNSATGDRMQQGIHGTPTEIQSAPGGSGTFQMVKIESMSDLEDHLGISADASGGVGLFSASDRFNFARDCKVQTQSITLMITCTRQNGFMQFDEPALDADAAALVANGQVDSFQQRYGDCFVAGIESGGQFFGVIRIDVRSDSDHQTIENSLSGSYGPFSGDVSLKVQSAMSETQSSAETFLYYEGGNVQSMPQHAAELFNAATEWSQSLVQAAKPYAALLVPWVIANGPTPPNAADLDHQKEVLKGCAKLRSGAIDRVNVLEYMTDPVHQNEFVFGPADLKRLQDLHAQISGDFDLIEEAASFAISNVKAAVEPETYARTVKGLPGYTLTMLPADLPKRVDGSNIPVPDFSKAATMADLTGLAGQSKLTLRYVMAQPQPAYGFCSQDPAAGTKVAAGATVTVVGNGQPANPMPRGPMIFRSPDLLHAALVG